MVMHDVMSMLPRCRRIALSLTSLQQNEQYSYHVLIHMLTWR